MIDLSRISPAAKQALMSEAGKIAARNITVRRKTLETAHFRGGNLATQECNEDEVVNVGPAGTGKTFAHLVKINRRCWQYPGLRVLIVRKVKADLAESVLVTLERDVLGADNPICQGVTRQHRAAYRYPNGSIIVMSGMDKPGSVLSSEWDIIYVAETTQITQNDWEMLGMRIARGSDYPFPQLIGDTNPDRPDHWLKKRIDTGVTRGFTTTLQDNPAMYTEDGELTTRGQRYMSRLSRLSGMRRLRYVEGKWSQAEGAIYDLFSESIHVIDAFDIPADWRRYRVVDFGYTNPFVCQWWAEDNDGRLYLYREIYHTKRTVEDHTNQIVKLSEGERISATVADHDAEDRETMRRYGVDTIAAKKDVSTGIDAVISRMKLQGDGKPRLFIMRGALVETDPDLIDDKRPHCTQSEVGGYVWSDKAKKEQPVKEHDHGLDAMRYLVMHVDKGVVWDTTREAFLL